MGGNNSKKLIIAKQIKTRQLRKFLSNESKTHIVQTEKDLFFFSFLLGFNNLTSVDSILIRRNRMRPILIITIPRLLLLLLEHIVLMMMTHGWHTHVAEHLRHHGGHVIIRQERSSGSEEMIGGGSGGRRRPIGKQPTSSSSASAAAAALLSLEVEAIFLEMTGDVLASQAFHVHQLHDCFRNRVFYPQVGHHFHESLV